MESISSPRFNRFELEKERRLLQAQIDILSDKLTLIKEAQIELETVATETMVTTGELTDRRHEIDCLLNPPVT